MVYKIQGYKLVQCPHVSLQVCIVYCCMYMLLVQLERRDVYCIGQVVSQIGSSGTSQQAFVTTLMRLDQFGALT